MEISVDKWTLSLHCTKIHTAIVIDLAKYRTITVKHS